MKRETFEQQLRDRLDGYEPQVPNNLWEEIDARLSSDTPTTEKQESPSTPIQQTKRSRVIPLWAKITAAAAVVVAAVLLIGRGIGGEEQENNQVAVVDQDVPDGQVNVVDTNAGDKGLENGHIGENANLGGSDAAVPVRTSGSVYNHNRGALAKKQDDTFVSQPLLPNGVQKEESITDTPSNREETENGLPPIIPANNIPQKEVANTDSNPEKSGENQPVPQTIESHLSLQVSPSLGGGTGEASPVSVSLYADNIFGRGGGASPVYMNPVLAASYNYASDNAPVRYHAAQEVYQLAGYADRSVHHRPVVAGISARIPLGGRWAVQTGLTYSWLSSEFYHDMHGVTITDKQSLQYLGIPLAVSYDIWNKGAFSLYAAAGGALHINTLSRLKTDGMKSHLSHDRLQWSMSAVVGAGYEFLPSFSLYVEPGVTWYPDNGSDIQNFFKDKPVNPSLQFGLRYRFSQR